MTQWSEEITQYILSHLNGERSETDLIHWAENALILLSESSDDVDNEALIFEILGYIGAGDSAGFPLSWTVLSHFLEQLGVRVRVSVA